MKYEVEKLKKKLRKYKKLDKKQFLMNHQLDNCKDLR